MAIINDAFVAGLHEPHRHIGAHSTKTDHAKLHLRSPMNETDHPASVLRPPRGGWCFWRRRPHAPLLEVKMVGDIFISADMPKLRIPRTIPHSPTYPNRLVRLPPP